MSSKEHGPDRTPADAPTVDHPHTKAILFAISSSNITALSSLLEKTDFDPDACPGPPRERMLGWAAVENQPLALSYLFQLSPSKEDVTPQLLRCYVKHIECYKALVAAHPHALAFGFGHMGDVFGVAVLTRHLDFMCSYAANAPSWNIDLNKSEVCHRPVLEWTAEYGETRVLRCLLIECGRGELLRVRGTDAIRAAIRGRNMDNLRCLLDHSPEGPRAVVDGWPLKEGEYPWQLDKRRKDGWDVPNLHYAAAVGISEAVHILLDAGADPDLLDGNGRKADIATYRVPAPIRFGAKKLRCLIM
ncbi:ANK-REP-REGION domain-containing protein [Mycena venus]|uniref:ANK-REP-REGION domain-containing protein n=1 Tax=Mycena venus TaxID=2733690 RepID=A0A8H7CLR1_9AGAR|nr:ANK-REP-REGION domain-containing protein [Mycena venus]